MMKALENVKVVQNVNRNLVFHFLPLKIFIKFFLITKLTKNTNKDEDLMIITINMKQNLNCTPSLSILTVEVRFEFKSNTVTKLVYHVLSQC